MPYLLHNRAEPERGDDTVLIKLSEILKKVVKCVYNMTLDVPLGSDR